MGGYTAKLARRIKEKGQAEAVPSSWRNMCRHLPSGLVGNCSHIMFMETHSVTQRPEIPCWRPR